MNHAITPTARSVRGRTPAPATLGHTDPADLDELLRAVDRARAIGGADGTGNPVAGYLALASEVAQLTPHPGNGSTRTRWTVLASLAALDVTAARVMEPHLDALSVLAEAGITEGDLDAVAVTDRSTWGVYAAEGKDVAVTAIQTPQGWRLQGVKPWCSLAGELSHGLITAHTGPGTRRLFAVDLRTQAVARQDGAWIARGLPHVSSGPITLTDAPAVPIGEDNWYLRRAGFAWGGAGVAACWWGGAVGLARRLVDRVRGPASPDTLTALQLGAVDLLLDCARSTLIAAADQIDSSGGDVVLVERTRGTVVQAAEQVLHRMGHALGPTPLAFDDWYAGQYAGLELYIRQHHGEKDLARLGELVLDTESVRSGAYPW
ncbi:acyl-CoA dehydrogenase [Nakamurella silvestris]|nr:acyl-CoA dehydrogenase [Nakamurella silvestris]